MRSGKTLHLTLLSMALGLGVARSVYAQAAPSFVAQVQPDALAIAQFINAPFAKSMGFISTLGWNTPPGVFELTTVTGPHVEVGVGAAADLMNFPSLSTLNLPALSANTNVTLPTVLPFPVPLATARIGLRNGLDIGFRLAYLPMVALPSVGFSANFVGWGLDLRYKIIDGVYLPTVAMGISYDNFSGSLGLGTNVSQTSTYTTGGTSYTANMTAMTNYALSWNVKSFGAKVEVGKDFGILYPFGAIGFQRNSGGITSNLAVNGNVTMSDASSAPINVLATTTSAPEVFEPKFVLGIDIGQGLHWAVVGESNGVDIAVSTSFRAQF